MATLEKGPWSPGARAALITALAIVMGSLFVTSYSLALGDPVPHRIAAALVGNPVNDRRAVDAVQRVTRSRLAFRDYRTVLAARHAIDEQSAYAVLDLTTMPPTLYVASAAGASVARVLEQIRVVDPSVRVLDTHPLASDDPNGLDIFYLMIVGTIIGMVTTFQVRANAAGLALRHRISFVLSLSVLAPLVLALVDGPLLHRPSGLYPEEWGILALHILAVASFASLMAMLAGRWALLPTYLFFVILGNASSGGAVSPPLLPQPFAFLSQWLPSGATVASLRNAVYFRDYQHARPLVVLGVWATALFGAWLAVSSVRLSRIVRHTLARSRARPKLTISPLSGRRRGI